MQRTRLRLRRAVRGAIRRVREVRMFARAMQSPRQPIVAQISPTRRCNLSCAYCNEFDRVSAPVPTEESCHGSTDWRRSGPASSRSAAASRCLHPAADMIIERMRARGAIATVITNGYLLTPARIERLNRTGLDLLQISIDNVLPDEVSKKSLKVLDQKLRWLEDYALFDVTVNSVVGSGIAIRRMRSRLPARRAPRHSARGSR
jgi:MoaA/NifB/PqqE/SkfB family radical SAM enzyme